MGKWRHNWSSQTRTKRSVLTQQVTAGQQQTDVHESITKQDRNNINDPQSVLKANLKTKIMNAYFQHLVYYKSERIDLKH